MCAPRSPNFQACAAFQCLSRCRLSSPAVCCRMCRGNAASPWSRSNGRDPRFPLAQVPPSNPSGIGLFDLAPSGSPLAVGPLQRAACRFRHARHRCRFDCCNLFSKPVTVRGVLHQRFPPAHPPGVISHHGYRSRPTAWKGRPRFNIALNLKMQFLVPVRRTGQGEACFQLMENCDVHPSSRVAEAERALVRSCCRHRKLAVPRLLLKAFRQDHDPRSIAIFTAREALPVDSQAAFCNCPKPPFENRSRIKGFVFEGSRAAPKSKKNKKSLDSDSLQRRRPI